MYYGYQIKYSTIKNGTETLFTVTVPDAEYGEMLRNNSNPQSVRSEILNEAGRVEQKRIEIAEYLSQELTPEQLADVRLMAVAIATHEKLVSACTDKACGYHGIQMRLAGGHRLSEGMQRKIEKIRETLEPVTENDIELCIDAAMNKLGHYSQLDYEYFKMRNGHKTWKIERVPVVGMDRETVLKTKKEIRKKEDVAKNALELIGR